MEEIPSLFRRLSSRTREFLTAEKFLLLGIPTLHKVWTGDGESNKINHLHIYHKLHYSGTSFK